MPRANQGSVAKRVVLVQLAWEGAAPRPAKIVATSRSAGAETIQVSVPAAGQTQLKVTAGAWEVRVVADGTWSTAATLNPGTTSVELRLFPEAKVRATLVPPAGVKAPSQIEVQLWSAPGTGKALRALADCGLSAGELDCRMPAGIPIDFRLQSKGFLRHYEWGRRLVAGTPVNLGKIELRVGSALAGWVRPRGQVRLASTCRAVLVPQGIKEGTPGLAGRTATMELAAPVNDRGFFRFESLSPGRYRVRVEQPGATGTEVTAEVLDGLEAEILDPLLLSLPQSLEVFIDPALDPDGDPWNLQLQKRTAGFRQVDDLGVRRASPAGTLRWPGLALGSYLLIVRRSSGEAWHTEDLDIEDAEAKAWVTLPAVEVEGSVRYGSDPLTGEVIFGGEHGLPRQALKVDEKGRFSGLLPRPGLWTVDIRGTKPSVKAHREQVRIEPARGANKARVDIVLPATVVRGVVVDPRGRPVSTAIVDIVHQAAAEYFQEFVTSADGSFTVRGLSPGPIVLGASGPQGKSKQVIVNIGEALETTVELRLVAERELLVRVESPWGAVPGATFWLEAAEDASPSFGYRHTSADGSSRVRIPEYSRMLEFAVSAPGLMFRFGRVPAPEAGELLLAVGQGTGTLRLTAPTTEAYLSHLGMTLALPSLRRWATIHSGAKPGAQALLVFEEMEPGTYSLCPPSLPTGPKPAADVPGHQCVTGELLSYGELELVLP